MWVMQKLIGVRVGIKHLNNVIVLINVGEMLIEEHKPYSLANVTRTLLTTEVLAMERASWQHLQCLSVMAENS